MYPQRTTPPGQGAALKTNVAGCDGDNAKYTTPADPINTLLNRLEGVRDNGRNRWVAKCPAHDDRSPSLSIRETSDGTILIHDFGGCSPTDILAAVGLELTDLFPDGPKAHHIKRERKPRRSARQVLDCVCHALTVVTLADTDLRRGIPLTNDDYDALDRALAVLNRAKGAA